MGPPDWLPRWLDCPRLANDHPMLPLHHVNAVRLGKRWLAQRQGFVPLLFKSLQVGRSDLVRDRG